MFQIFCSQLSTDVLTTSRYVVDEVDGQNVLSTGLLQAVSKSYDNFWWQHNEIDKLVAVCCQRVATNMSISSSCDHSIATSL